VTELLLNRPCVFFTNEFTPFKSIHAGGSVPEIVQNYLDELQYVLVVKTMAVFNLITRGNYYWNVVIFNAIFFFGHYWLYRLMTDLFPAKKKLYFIIIFFFLPAVFWLSGIRVDGMLFFFLCLLLYNACGNRPAGIAKKILVAIGFAGVLICKPQVALICAYTLLAYSISRRTGKTLVVYGAVWLFALVLFFASALFMKGGGLPGKFAEKQNQFSNLKGTKFGLRNLDPSPVSYIKAFPQASANVLFRPLPWESKGFLQLIASAEVAAFWIIIIASIYYRHRFWKIRVCHPVVLTLLLIGVSTYIFIGYIVPFPGAIVRYKAFAEILILCGMVSISRWGETSYYKEL
jgi:hypothetical protein